MELNESENIFDKLRELAGQINGNFNIMENKVDINVQIEYFQYSKKVKSDLDKDELLNKIDDLFDVKKSLAEKKHLLSQLASIDDVKIFRAIEKYTSDPDILLKDWSLMAYNESKMLLESSLLDENQIFISTGLGGKGSKLRYFIVLFTKSGNKFNKVQQKVIRNEFEYILDKNEADVEDITFSKNFSSLMVLLPLTSAIHSILKAAIDECNQYGGFIKESFIITNVKQLTEEEITTFINKNEIPGISNQENMNSIEPF